MSDFSIEHERSLVEGLRPRPDQSVLAAVFSTYSLDLLALLSVVLGLSGLDCSEMDADPIDLNRSLFVLNKRVVVLCQRGRIRSPKTAWRARVLSMLDRTIVQIPFDERQRSWHAKLALVAYGSKSGPRVATEWRLWIGSRNLTRSTDLDLGILLIGTPSQNSSSKQKKVGIPGLLSALEDLLKAGGEPVRRVLSFASKASGKDLPSIHQLLDEMLRNVRWKFPLGLSVEKISAHYHQNDVADVLKVSLSAKGASVLIGSPFVDQGGLDHLGRYVGIDGAKHATLISTSAALDSLQRAPGNLVLRSADQSSTQHIDTDPIQSDEDSPLESSDSDEGPIDRGLHAKFVLVTGADSPQKLILGSANLTARGLKNINAEILVRIRISKVLARNFKHVLISTLSQEYVKVPPDLEALAIEEARERLDAVRRQLAAELDLSWDFSGATMLRALKAPSFDSKKMRLQVAPLARPEFACQWPPGQKEISFGGLTTAEQGQLVVLTLTEIDTGEAICWLQKASDVEEDQLQRRDDALAAELLSLRNILQIIQAELAGTPPARGMPWHVRSYKSKGGMEQTDFGDLQLEDLLRSRARDAEWSRDVVTRIGNTLEMLLQTSDSVDGPDIAAFLQFWKPFAAAFGGTS